VLKVSLPDRIRGLLGRSRWLGKLSGAGTLSRESLACTYLRGSGLEIGALHSPLRVPAAARVTYVDRLTVQELRQHYPELRDLPLVAADIVDDGERLGTIGDESQDFVIANHFIEHCEDPIGTIETFRRVLRAGGIVYLAVPDKRFTFDRNRPLTTLDHLLADHRQGPAMSRREHLEEWARVVGGQTEEGKLQTHVEHLDRTGYSIHFHVWTVASWLELMVAVHGSLGLEVEAVLSASQECITILRKGSPAT
jgi:SAM-dependent methyltransferase